MEITKISKEEILKGLHIGMTDSEVNDYISKMEEAGLPKDFTEVIYDVYKKGICEYIFKYCDAQTALEEMTKKYNKLTDKVCEKFIINE